jgi:hypothetical protein
MLEVYVYIGIDIFISQLSHNVDVIVATDS